jgi:hypothetical protein
MLKILFTSKFGLEFARGGDCLKSFLYVIIKVPLVGFGSEREEKST